MMKPKFKGNTLTIELSDFGYELKCFERGNELFEKERLKETNDGKE